MNRERLLELAGLPLTEAKKCECGCDPKTCECSADCKCGCNAVTEMHHEGEYEEQGEYEEAVPSIFSTMTHEEFKGIGAALGLAWDRAVGDLQKSGEERPKEKAFELVSRQVDDALRKLEQEATD